MPEYPPLYRYFIRLHNSHILSPVESFETVASTLFGVQSQILNASAIAFALRTQKQTFSRFIYELETLRLIRLWGLRTTLHIYHRDDWECLLLQLSEASNWYSIKMASAGVDVNSLINIAVEAIGGKKCFDRDLLIEGGINRKHLGSWGDLLIELNNRGYLLHKTELSSKERRFLNAHSVLGSHPKFSDNILDDMRREISTRYFLAYAPATAYDFAHWLGVNTAKAREYIQLIKDDLIPITCDGIEYFIYSSDFERNETIYHEHLNDNKYWLLPKFDPLLLAYHDKTWIAQKQFQKKIWRVSGHVEGVVMQHGNLIATWRYKLTSKTVNFEYSPCCSRFSLVNMERNCYKIALFFERPIGSIRLSEV